MCLQSIAVVIYHAVVDISDTLGCYALNNSRPQVFPVLFYHTPVHYSLRYIATHHSDPMLAVGQCTSPTHLFTFTQNLVCTGPQDFPEITIRHCLTAGSNIFDCFSNRTGEFDLKKGRGLGSFPADILP